MKYIDNDNLYKLLDALGEEYRVFVPEKRGEHRFYREYSSGTDAVLIGEVRSVEPLKSFFTKAQEKVAEDFKSDTPGADDKPFAIVGVKACDLKGFKVQDFVFKSHDAADPFYLNKREKNLVISADCTCTIETCFCAALGDKPYPKSDFDLNLSLVEKGFVVEVGSERGRKIVDRNSGLFQDAVDETVTAKDKQREDVSEQVENNVKSSDMPRSDALKGVIEKTYESDTWQDEARECVECGACTIICPSCHCFLLYDQKDDKRMARLKAWDSCMIKDYARVAGGANPRDYLWMRLRNRFEKKFDFFPKVAEVFGCTGCGRCISACPAKIDIRKVLNRLVKDA
ncbi:4Fe-4S dicluster domain-containing protein [Candidatus Omnitrophota bacterium]